MERETRTFISYAHQDEVLIGDDTNFLRSSGFGISLNRSIRPGTDWRSQIADSLATSDVVLFFSSANSNTSKHCLAEISFALDLEKPVVIVMLQDCRLAPGLRLYLGQLQGIQRFRLPQEEYLQTLVSSLTAIDQEPESLKGWSLILSSDLASETFEPAVRIAEAAIKLKSLEHPELSFEPGAQQSSVENPIRIQLTVRTLIDARVEIAIETNTPRLQLDEILESPDHVYLGTRLAELSVQILLRATDGEIDIDLSDVLEVDSKNPHAVVAYLEGTQDQYAGEIVSSIRKFERSLQIDPNFGLAARGAAAVGSILGKDTDVEKYFRIAFSKLSAMTPGEKARTKSAYYLAVGDFQRAIPELRECTSVHPSSHAAKGNLALAYLYARNVKLALSTARSNFAASPASFFAGANLAMYLMYAGEFEESEEQIRSLPGGKGAFALNTTLVICQLMLGKSEDARILCDSMILGAKTLRTAGALGLADLSAYADDYSTAFRTLCANPPDSSDPLRATHLAYKAIYAAESESASLDDLLDSKLAIESAREGHGTFIDLFLLGRAAIAFDRLEEALAISTVLKNKGITTASVYSKLLECEARLEKGADPGPVVQSLIDTNSLLDTWHGHYLLASSYRRLGATLDAHAEWDTCISRSGEGVAYMLDEIPTTHLLARVKNRYQESLASL